MKNGSGISIIPLFGGILALLVLFPVTILCQTETALAEKLAAQAEVIAIGKVSAISSEWNEDRSMIRTKVTLSVDQFVKGGSSQNSLTIYVPGGEIDGVGEIYSHMPSFRQNEEVVVFAERDRENRYRVSAGSQGKFSVEKDKTTGVAMTSGGTTLDELKERLTIAVQMQREDEE